VHVEHLRGDVFFFFQAEDGIRDYKVTGVQTCALPICKTQDNAPSLVRWVQPLFLGSYHRAVNATSYLSMKRCVYIRPWFLTPFFLIVAVVVLVPASVSAPPQNAQAKSGTLTQVAKTIAERLGYPANSRLLIIHADDVGM